MPPKLEKYYFIYSIYINTNTLSLFISIRFEGLGYLFILKSIKAIIVAYQIREFDTESKIWEIHLFFRT